MKTIDILKKLITIYFYLQVLGFVVLAIVVPILFSLGKFNTLEFLDNHDISNLSFGRFMSMLLVALILAYQYVKAIYLLKNSLSDLSNGNYFSELVINNFKIIGKLFLICGVGAWLYKIVLRLAFMSDVRIGIDNILVLLTIMGLFFMFLSEVFAKARKTEQENDLTI